MRLKSNDHDKVARLYELYEQKLYLVAFSILNNQWQAEDAVQEAFVRIIKNRDKIKNPESDESKRFLIRIIQSTAIDIYRKNQKDCKRFAAISEQGRDEMEEADSIEDMLNRTDSEEKVQNMLKQLPDNYREVLVYRCIHQLSVRETAAILEISEAAVRKRFERARILLMKLMGDEQYECKVI